MHILLDRQSFWRRNFPGGGHMDKDVAYYTRRVADERRAAMAAADEKSRRCHFEIAAVYEARLNELKMPKPRATLHIANAGRQISR